MLLHSPRSVLSKVKCVIQPTRYRIHDKPKFNLAPSYYWNTKKCLFCSKTNEKLVITKIDPNIPSVAHVIMNRAPVNSLSLEMCTEIKEKLSKIEANNPKIQSIVLSSSNPKVFSAGLDIITELYKPNPQRLRQFWKSFQDLYLSMYTSKLAIIAALEGTAVAGGCMIAMSCDYRILSSSGSGIGLNETKLGIAAPIWMSELMVRTIGFRKAELALAQGYVFNPDEALQIGLVDDICERDNVLHKANEQAKIWSKIPQEARIASKLSLRQKYVDQFMSTRDEDVEFFCNFIQQDIVQENIGKYIQSLKMKKKGPK